ncbi:type III polyketide synthase [Solitalea sp. MAHUQ-68]|uniref:Type III polyketide synthase n=1 Tax=Solitalea agri TaxID=2953739 RepID=A0A9X2F722_9SPHI|nr:type III polyketide synthase [Solitalea agri]MCO4293551.1 type III polyketide synthase [Solitalea agri]
MSKIISIATANPTFKHKQEDILQYMTEVLQPSLDEKKLLNILYQRSGIKTRYSVLPEFSERYASHHASFFDNVEEDPALEARMKVYHQHAGNLGMESAKKCMEGFVKPAEVTHLITVSCTGLSAPGLDIELVELLGLEHTVYRTSVNFMGCYAALHALKHADLICKAYPNARVLIVSVEICTIHFQAKNDMDNMMANLLFADGAASALVCSDEAATQNNWKGLQIENTHSEIHFKGKKDMAWKLSETGFLMTLSNYIPDLVEAGIKNLVAKTVEAIGKAQSDIKHWAIHPGGKRILDVVQKELTISSTDLQAAYSTLEHYGNMSSPTILYVLKDIMDTKVNWAEKEMVFAAGFGPGLTMESMILSN